MKQLAIFLAFLLAVALVIAGYWVIDDALYGDPDNPPREQVVESVDESPTLTDAVGGRSWKWETVRNQHVMDYPVCEACGSDENLNVHHVKPFHEHPELELDPTNLITLCREHHFRIGHDPDGPGPKGPNWKLSNPKVWSDAKNYRDSLSLTP